MSSTYPKCEKCHGTGRWGDDGKDLCPECHGWGNCTSECKKCGVERGTVAFVGSVCLKCFGKPDATAFCDFSDQTTGPHGEHYAGAIQPVDLIDSLGWGDHWDLGNALKYICRAGKKKGVAAADDLDKAIWHLERRRERERERE